MPSASRRTLGEKILSQPAAEEGLDSEAWRRMERSLQDGLGIIDLSYCGLDDRNLLRVWEYYRRGEGSEQTNRAPGSVWYLRLSHNRLQHFPAWLVAEVGETLRILDLSYNRLCSPLDGLELVNMPRLEVLSLSHNEGIRELHSGIVDGLFDVHPLRLVNLSHTSLKWIDALCSQYTSSIRVLKIEYCDIEELPESTGYWQQLWSLDLSFNPRLARLPHSALALAPSLRRLSVEGCKLMETPPPARIRKACTGEQGPMALIRWLIDQSNVAPSDRVIVGCGSNRTAKLTNAAEG
ncbi:hypothetical protein CCYA_CCYA16G4167 [Cyanidiococcus yangmingshanensis]|nr:hypothetical protein CCYA_CCYA16G4167 [Cyanidiococcus yangmingshanensis]